jgi:hypothetical protein
MLGGNDATTVGSDESSKLGDGVGPAVGLMLGENDATSVGSDECSKLGDGVGSAEGLMLGGNDATTVGSDECSKLGDGVGSAVGSLLGDRVGTVVGPDECSILGDCVGPKVGSDVGADDGTIVGYIVGSPVGPKDDVTDGASDKITSLSSMPIRSALGRLDGKTLGLAEGILEEVSDSEGVPRGTRKSTGAFVGDKAPSEVSQSRTSRSRPPFHV